MELRLEDVSKTFPPDVAAVSDINLTVASGSCLALLGPSGCGKTTLLRLIAGLEEPSSGWVFFDGNCMNDVPSHCRGVALHFQRPTVIPQQSVRASLAWTWTFGSVASSLFGSRRHNSEAVNQIARLLDLEKDLDRRVGELSGGQQQRVALGRCLLRREKLHLFDEPLGQLDAPLRTNLRRRISGYIREIGATSVHVTHDPGEAFAVGDQVAILERGRLVQWDTPAAIRRAPATRYVAELIHQDTGGMNLLAGQVHRDDLDTYFESPLGRWPMSVQTVRTLRESLCEAENFHPGEGKVDIMMGVAVEDVHCTTAADARGEDVCVEMPTHRLESGDKWTLVIAKDSRGSWIGQAGSEERLEPGQKAIMRFALANAYWFDIKTGRTLAAPTC